MPIPLFSRFARCGTRAAASGILILGLCAHTPGLYAQSMPVAPAPVWKDPWRVLESDTPSVRLPGDQHPLATCNDLVVPNKLSLRRALEIALCRNPQARLAWTQVQQQSATRGQARAPWLPTVSANFSTNRDRIDNAYDNGIQNRSVTDVRTQGKNLSLNLLLLDFGTRSANISQADNALAAALSSHENALQTVFGNAAQAYFEAIAARAALEAAQETEKNSKEIAAAAEGREHVGTVTHMDVLQARSLHAQARLARVKAEGTYRAALGLLAAQLGIDARFNSQLELDENFSQSAIAIARSKQLLEQLEPMIAAAIDDHPAVRAARAQLSAAESHRDAVKGEGLPTLSFTFNRYLNGRPGTTLSAVRSYESYAGITLALPIFEGFGRTYKIHEATGQVAQKREELAQVITQTDLDIWRNYQNFLAENSGLEAAADLLNAAREGFDAAETRYRVGITDIVEVLNNGKILAGARQEYVRAWSAWHGNRLKLLTSLGRAGFWLVDSLESTGSTR